MNKKVSFSTMVTVALIAVAVTFSITMVAAMRIFDTTVSSVKEKENMYAKLSEIDRYVRDNDSYTPAENTLNDMLASGYVLGSSDPYAKYYTADAYTELVNIQNGTLMGIGVDAVKDATTGYAKVTKVYAGSPAEDIGLTKGCYLTTIDGTDTKTYSTTDSIMSHLRGENGTTVDVGWLTTMAEANDAVITRRSYTISTVDYQYVENGNYGYIKISNFADSTLSELDYAIRTVEGAGATSLVFDLRDNAGGSLEAAMECIDLVCPEGVIANSVAKDGTVTTLMESAESSKIDLPAVCIVNGSTASGAELFAYMVRSLNGARIVGTTTAGHGTIQAAPKLLTDGSAIVVTTATLQAGDGTSFDGTGVTVDSERALSDDESAMYYDYTVENDPQILRAFSAADSLTGVSTVSNPASSVASSVASEPAASDATADPGSDAASASAAQ